MDLAVIIVTWNVRKLVLDALRTLYADLESSGLSAQVVVVDSASSDDTVSAVRQHFPQVHIIASDNNLGFAGGNNAAMRWLGFGDDKTADRDLPSAVYLLNPDTLTRPGATRVLFDTLMAHDRCGVVGARLFYEDGTHQHSSFTFPGLRQLWVEFFPIPGRLIEGRFNGRYPLALYTGNAPFPVDFMLGATMMLRAEVIQQVGMFDPRFFMYAEEVDWQWRIRRAGWDILCMPQAQVVHLAGKSTTQIQATSIVNLWRSRLRLFEKHYPAWKQTVAKWLIRSGMARKIRMGVQNDSVPDNVISAYRQVQEIAE